MALTLPEAAKLSKGELQRKVVETFAKSSPVLEMLPFMEVEGNSYGYNLEDSLPEVGFRGVNESFKESVGVINQQFENLVIMGGDLDVDRFIAQTREDPKAYRALQNEMKVKSLALSWTDQFFNGDIAVTPDGFDGLRKRIAGDQVIQVGENGLPLNIRMLDALIDQVEGGPDVIFLNKELRRNLKHAIQDSPSYSESSYDAFGKKVMSYDNIPIKVIEANHENEDILGFDETLGNNNEVASIYAVKFGGGHHVSGIQNGGISVRDLGELIEKPVFRTRVEWFLGLGVFHPKAAARLVGITRRK